ncbi:MAG: YhdP family protein [Gammaproteobacteria bacterium]
MEHVIKKITKIFGYVVLHFTVFSAVALSLVRIAMPYAENYLGTIEKWAQSQVHLNITISNLDSGWHGFGPALRFKGITIADAETGKQVASMEYVDVQLDVLASLMKWDWVLGRLTVEGLNVTLRETGGAENLNAIPWPVLQQFKRISVEDATVHWLLKNGQPITLNIIDFSVRPQKENQRVELAMYIGDRHSRFRFIVDTAGDWRDPLKMKIKGYARLKNVVFDPRYMPSQWHDFTWQHGLMNGDVWFDYDGGIWRSIVGRVDLKDAVVKNDVADKILPFSFVGEVALEGEDDGHIKLTADDVSFTVHEKLSALKSWVVDIDPVKPWEARFNAISLFDAVSIARVLGYLTPEQEKKLVQHDPHARLYNIEWVGLPGDAIHWHVGFQVSDAYEKSEGTLPGIDNLAGTVKLTATHGEFEVDTKNLTLVVPTVYPHALEIDGVHGVIDWTYDPLVIHTQGFEIVEEDATAKVDLTLTVPEKDPAQLKLFVETGRLTREEILYYLPGKVLGAGLFHWISDSLVKGEVTKATGRVEGSLKDFPYENGNGLFELQFALKDATLNYQKHWPPITDINAQLVIDGKKFQGYIDSGKYRDTVIKQAVAAVDYSDLNKPLVLLLSGDIEGPANNMEQFLRESPLWETMGTGMEWVDVVGTLDTRLDLKIPLDEKTQADTTGIVSMKKGLITLPSWKVTFDDVTGSVAFKNGCITAKDIQATFLHHSANIGVSCKETSGKTLHDWVLNSNFGMKDIEPYLSPMFKPLISGDSTYSMTLSTISGKGDSTLTFQSDLKGIAIAVPEPLAKAADAQKSLTIRLPLKSDTVLNPVVTYDGLFNAALTLKKEGEKYLLKAVNLMLGKEAATPAKSDGYFVGGKITALDVDSWLTFFEKFKQSGEKPLTVQGGFWVDTLFFKGFRLEETFLSWKRLATAWQVTLDGPGAKGVVMAPDTISLSAPLSLNFERYVWKPTPGADKSPDGDPRQVPPINFNCRQFFYQNQSLGEVNIQIRPIPNGVGFEPVTVKSDVHQLTATGSWIHTAEGQTETAFQGNAKSNDIGKTLIASGLKSDIEDSKSDMTFDLRWVGSPGKFNKATVRGDVDINLKKGRLTAVNPGLGRLLGLFSVESIARRLQFDFSDVFQKGFAFDAFQSKINIHDGTAYTTDATMKAPSANMTLSGKVSLVSQVLDLDLDVKSTANSAVPTIGAAAVAIANPAIGAAVWLAGKMFNPLEGLGHYRYHITGTWQSPVFTDISHEIKPPKEVPVREAH